MSEGEFVALLGGDALAGPTAQPANADEDESEGWSYETVHSSGGPRGPVDLHSHEVYVLKKRVTMFPATIMIGRALSNDVTIDDVSISKLHARARRMEDGTYALADADSRNGTVVNGRRLGAGEDVVIDQGDTITFGNRVFRLYRAKRIYSLLRMMVAIEGEDDASAD